MAPEPAEPVAVPAASVVDVAGEVLAVVADKTGYPSDMLDLDLDLEADLGIDTVKQAEVFATIRERLRHPARRQAEAARLPDAGPRRRASSTNARRTAAAEPRRGWRPAR